MKRIITLICFGLLLSTTAFANPLIRVEGASFKPLPIAVTDAQISKNSGLKKTANELVERIRQDLDFTGVFQILDPKGFLITPDQESFGVKDIQYESWRNVGADALLKFSMSRQGDVYVVDVYAYDVGTQKSRFKRNYKAPSKMIFKLAHLISDDVFEAFTGEKGVMSQPIAAIKRVGKTKHVVQMDVDGQKIKQLSKGGRLNLLPSYAPNAKKILYTSYRYDNPDLFELDVATRKYKRLSARPGLNTGGVFSPDGSQIAVTLSMKGNTDIYLLSADGKDAKRLTDAWGIDTSPSWSPDGSKIAFVSSRSGNPHIFVMDKDGSNQKRLTFKGKYNQTPRWSPRGTHIVFSARDERNKYDIFLMDVRSSVITRITQDQSNNEDPAFAANGRLVVFTSTRDGARDLYLSNLDGSHQRRITQGGFYWTPTWAPFQQ
ncbi:MAG: Tol-Pal system beta propeller repeat protein TolB [Myxococcales bacterium]|nr:Tol-Pal system beta propeller repeat protein TolB [Myxococcales bacterium]|tara:strand:+ start:616 stop:1914 length:1299 start_codon:yes stop_codon:yes gene_type:complete